MRFPNTLLMAGCLCLACCASLPMSSATMHTSAAARLERGSGGFCSQLAKLLAAMHQACGTPEDEVIGKE